MDKPGDRVEIECDCGKTVIATIVGGEAQLLEWNCDKCGYKRDVNA